MGIDFKGKVAIVTGAGGGLGRAHALELAKRGAKVVVNDLGGAMDGSGGSSKAAEAVVAEIKAAGGEAIATGSSVSDRKGVDNLVKQTMEAFGRIDILINNAGILRDKSFKKMELDDFQIVIDVHLMGSAYCTKAVWPIMTEQNYGRIVMTTSPSGLYGNFGQANYGAAKLGVVGFMNTLKIEGAKNNVRINAIAPVAATRMTENLMPQQMLRCWRSSAPSWSPPASCTCARKTRRAAPCCRPWAAASASPPWWRTRAWT
jgi:NAD(P)-dependent dehydrogenase (short-subunit alcohol dehydrogenase family)